MYIVCHEEPNEYDELIHMDSYSILQFEFRLFRIFAPVHRQLGELCCLLGR